MWSGLKSKCHLCDRGVTQVPFKGCIKDVQLGTLAKDLNENIEFKDVSPGCTEVSNSHFSFPPVCSPVQAAGSG